MKIENDTWQFVARSLTQLQSHSDALAAATNGLMLAPESPLLATQAGTEQLLINALNRVIDDPFDTIGYYIYECDYGRNPQEAGTSVNTRPIDSLDALRWLIEVTE